MIPEDRLNRYIFIMWFVLAVSALGFSGIYSILPFILRAPFLAEIFPLQNFFRISLIVHVNLGVLVWFLASNAMFMIKVSKKEFAPIALSGFFASMIGTVFMLASPFIGAAEPVLNNYIPILHNLSFILGISLFFSGIIIQVLLTLLSYKLIKQDPIALSVYYSALIFVVAIICFILSFLDLKQIALIRYIDLHEYYELLFWGAGHVLQFNYVELIVIVWFSLRRKDSFKYFSALQMLNFMLVIAVIIPYLKYSIDSAEFYNFFTRHMKDAGGILLVFVAIWSLFKLNKLKKIEKTTYLCSLFLILSGGVIGYLISGMNVTIPAHYHGMIIGITVGLMGMFYLLLEPMGFASVKEKFAIVQMIIYTFGQFLHITGLAASGGYGVLRKNTDNILSVKAKIYMGIMGAGGAIALIGGIMFIALIFKSIGKKDKLI